MKPELLQLITEETPIFEKIAGAFVQSFLRLQSGPNESSITENNPEDR